MRDSCAAVLVGLIVMAGATGALAQNDPIREIDRLFGLNQNSSVRPPPAASGAALEFGWVDLATLIWFHPAMKDYVPEAGAFLRGPPQGSDPQQIKEWSDLVRGEFEKRQKKAFERLAVLRKEEGSLEQDQTRHRKSLDGAASKVPLKTKEDQAAARLTRADGDYWGKEQTLARALETNRAEQARLYREANEVVLETREETEKRRKKILDDIRQAIQEAAQAARVSVVFPLLAATVSRPRPPEDPSLIEPGSLANSYQFALLPPPTAEYEPQDLKQVRVKSLVAWYNDRTKAIPFAGGDWLLSPIYVSGQDLTVPVLRLLLKREGVPDHVARSVARFISEVSK